MREDLARELPEAQHGFAWIRARIRVWNEPIVWASVSGIGAGFLVGLLTQALVGLAREVSLAYNAPLPLTLFPVVTITGSAAAAAVALRSGGPVALALYVAYVSAGVALSLPGLMFFCERSGGTFPSPGPDQCTLMGFVAALWPQLIGLGLGVALAQVVRARGDGVNSLYRVAGAVALAQAVVALVSGALAVPATAASQSTWIVAAAFAAGVIAGGVLAAQLRGGIRSAATVAAIWLLPWFTTQVPFAARLSGPIPPENVLPIVASIVLVPIAAALLVLTAAIASRTRFTPAALRRIES